MKKPLKFIVVIAAMASFAFTIPPKDESRIINVIIDAGHGGTDNGATFGTFTEKEIVAQISDKIREQNKHENVIINFTRTEDYIPTLEQRTDFINQVKPDLVLSLHVNQVKDNVTASGMRIFIAKENANNPKSEAFAQKFISTFTKNHAMKVGEIQKAPLYLLKNSQAPALLIELGFISNEQDRKWLTNAGEQTKIANTILEFIGEIE